VKNQCENFGMELLINKVPTTEYNHNGHVFVAGKKGSKYTLRIHNWSDRRATAVISVDGLSITNGQPASPHDTGYIIGRWHSIDVLGWRINDDDVAHFGFGELPEAYASQMNIIRNIGVIGVIFFYEEAPPCNSFNMCEAKGIGTIFGERTSDPVKRTAFNRENRPAAQLIMRYGSSDDLIALGVPIDDDPQRIIQADPFPTTGCPIPKNWR